MKKQLLYLGFYGATQLICSCQQKQEDAKPSPAQPIAARKTIHYDTLAVANGHWEWDTWTMLVGRRTPTTEGYTRQLIFRPNLKLLIKHNGQPYDSIPYLLISNVPVSTPAGSRGNLSYSTPEPRLVNNYAKYFSLTIDSAGNKLLTIAGERAGLDGGAYEGYHWVKD